MTRTTRTLRNLRIDEVSGVDKGAGRGVRVMLMKRDGEDDAEEVATATAALAKSICSILEDDEVTDPKAAIEKSVEQFQEFITSGLMADNTEETNMDHGVIVKKLAEVDDVDVLAVVRDGIATGKLEKADVSALRERKALQQRKEGESDAQANARFMTKNVTGMGLYAIEKSMSGLDHRQKRAAEFHKLHV